MKKQRRLVALMVATVLLAGCATETAHPVVTKSTSIPISGRQAPSGKLVWSDEFSGLAGAAPDSSNWSPNVGGQGWGNKQLEYDTANQNVYQDGQGHLVLEARKDPHKGLHCWYGPCEYTSARISTKGHYSFIYGYVESRIKIPAGQGFWPAFWLLGDNISSVGWPACGELDIMEIKGKEPSINYGAVHSPVELLKTYTLQDSSFADSFHTFALHWTVSHLAFSVDGNIYARLDKASLTDQQKWVFDHPFNIILNLAVGGLFPENPDDTTAFPEKMQVDYIRVYS